MSLPPALQPLHRLGLGGRSSDLDERHLCPSSSRRPGPLPRRRRRHHPLATRGLLGLPALRELDPRRLALLLGELRGPGGIAEPRGLVLGREVEQWPERAGSPIDAL